MLPLLAAGLVIACIASMGQGQLEISSKQILSILAAKLFGVDLGWQFDDVQASVLFSIRLPRVVLALMVGSALSVSGATLQGIFRNPLADPTLLGVSSGAALSVSAAIVLGGAFILASPWFLPLVALVGGLAATLTVWRVSTRNGQTSVLTMLLAGIAINALCGAGIGLCIYGADDAELRDLTFWMLGSLGGATWSLVLGAAPFIVAALIFLPRLARGLDAMLLGEKEAHYLGIQVNRLRRQAILLTALAVGAAVSVSGVIGFVGLIVPHMLRLVLGPAHRRLLPASMLLGGLALVSADIFARTALPPADLPIGIVTALVGSPLFLWLLVKKGSGSHA
jgi:iron complex transport system permease protein